VPQVRSFFIYFKSYYLLFTGTQVVTQQVHDTYTPAPPTSTSSPPPLPSLYHHPSVNPQQNAVQAAKTVVQDVSGIDLNCGCPKPFSTHSGMGAALLTNPHLLCSILTALRKELPPHITVTAKIRLLPSQEDTLKLVERIVNTL
jgi:tRNA-dihydrouridine synthase 2